jgi:MoaA/NifB/PqqE/SkfB family radical SAM enzyme
MGRITDVYVQNQKYARPNLDISHRCILRCPQCIRQKDISQSQIKRSFDLEEKDFQKILNYYNNGVTFCGQISDPIYHPNFLNFLKMCHGQGRAIRIATNGTGKSREWWEEAFSYGKGENAWYFGVDGIDEKSELYRVGSNFKNVWEMMKLGKSLGHTIVWQYIIFGYNENDIDQAIEIAKKEGFTLLLIKTNRGFNPDNGLYRKSVKMEMGTPAKENRADKIKGEAWGYRTIEIEIWQRLGRTLLKNKDV